MHDLSQIIDTCAETTRSKGFKVDQHATQITLVATEVAEALECVSESGDRHTDRVIRTLKTICDDFEAYRKNAKDYKDNSRILDEDHLLEELSDKCIRVFSYVGGNDLKDRFLVKLTEKMRRNQSRPHLHGKGF